ncbi:MAG: DUF58 domain-containing protein [Candidatus Obscuribacterales bacterium]|nr:DUF58 domain-containing protein [Candidatus Obscuribacterales bacterium]
MNHSISQQLDRLRPLFVEIPIRIDWLASQQRLGDRKSSARGSGRDYCDFRPLNHGDDLRRINWKMLAKRPERPMLTLFEEEHTARVCVFTDISPTMDMASVALSKLELATVLTASIMRSAARTNDQAQLSTYDAGGIVRHYKTRAASRLTRTGAACVLATDERSSNTNAKGGLARALQRLNTRRSLVFVISDFLNLEKEDLEALGRTGQNHEVVCLVIEDLRERDLPEMRLLSFLRLPGLYTVIDSSNRQQTILTTKSCLRKHARRFDEREQKLFKTLSDCHAKFARMRTDEEHAARKRKLARIFAGRRLSYDLN